MATITGFVTPKRDYAVFVVVMGMESGIPLVIERGNFPKKMWKLPGGRPSPEDKGIEEVTAMREVIDEIGVVVEYPEKEVLRIPKPKHDFIVLEAKYFSGELKAQAEIERVERFNLCQIQQMIVNQKILPDHAKALGVLVAEMNEVLVRRSILEM